MKVRRADGKRGALADFGFAMLVSLDEPISAITCHGQGTFLEWMASAPVSMACGGSTRAQRLVEKSGWELRRVG